MKIQKVEYSKLLPTGVFANERIGFEASVEDGESPIDVIAELRNLCELSHKSQYPHLYTENGKPVTYANGGEDLGEMQVQQIPKDKRVSLLIKDIESEKVLRLPDGSGGLLSWQKVVEANPELKPAFDKRLKELENK